MERLIKKYMDKAMAQGLCTPDGDVLMCALDDELVWSRRPDDVESMAGLFSELNIASFMMGRPAEPYGSILAFLADTSDGAIRPRDSETRTFLHDLPVAASDDVDEIVRHLSGRKAVVLPGGRVATFGSVSPMEAFVSFSSVCFAAYVKFMSSLIDPGRSPLSGTEKELLQLAQDHLELPPAHVESALVGPFETEEQAILAMCEAGRITVEHKLVDSFFGNVSAKVPGDEGDVVYISQTGSSLDELEGCIDPCPMKGGSTAGLTASSELSAHMGVYRSVEGDVILHGHPRFSVIMSLACDDVSCDTAGRCHVACPKERYLGDVPIVPGEVGTGPMGLCNTVPPAIARDGAAIVLGHGLFVVAKTDFSDAINRMFAVERMCINMFDTAVKKLL